ncbi:MAG: hypothetical protein ACFE0I_24605 [Elainellaceae cyanobacterium]
MSDHTVADCPKCGKRDLVLRDDGRWVCLNPSCNFTERMPRSRDGSDFFSAVVAAFIVAVFMVALFG